MHRVGINRFGSNKISLIIQSGCQSHMLFSFSLFSAPAFFKYAKLRRQGNEISQSLDYEYLLDRNIVCVDINIGIYI